MWQIFRTLALPHLRESARIYRAIGRVDSADNAAHTVIDVEQNLRQVVTATAAAASAAAVAVTRG